MPSGCEGQTDYGSSSFVNCRRFTGIDGLRELAEEVNWDLLLGLPMGADRWVNDNTAISHVKTLYPTSADIRPVVKADRMARRELAQPIAD